MKIRIPILIIAIVAIAMLAIGGYLWWSEKSKTGGTQLGDLEKLNLTEDKITDSAVKGVLPSIQTNPLEEKPDLNPVDKTNPYKNIKTNPFK